MCEPVSYETLLANAVESAARQSNLAATRELSENSLTDTGAVVCPENSPSTGVLASPPIPVVAETAPPKLDGAGVPTETVTCSGIVQLIDVLATDGVRIDTVDGVCGIEVLSPVATDSFASA